MARISGVDLPRDKRIEIALTYIYGIGRSTVAPRFCAQLGINRDTKVRDLTEDEVAKLRDCIDAEPRWKATCAARARRTSSA